MSTPASGDEYEYDEENFKRYFQRLVRRHARGAVRGVQALPGVDASEELMQRAEDVCFCLGLHAHHVAQGQGWKLVAGDGPPAERVVAALARVASGSSYAAPLARRLVDAPPSDFGRVCRLALWAMIGTPEHERGCCSRAFSESYLRKR